MKKCTVLNEIDYNVNLTINSIVILVIKLYLTFNVFKICQTYIIDIAKIQFYNFIDF